MKKFISFVVLFLVLGLSNTVSAATLKLIAEAQTDFSSEKPSKDFTVKVKGTYNLKNGEIIPDGMLINGEIVKVKQATRGRRDAYANMLLKDYAINGTTYQVNNPNAIVKITAYEPIDMKEKGIDLGISAAGFVVKNISYPVNFVRGVVSPEEGENRLKAGVRRTYEGSFFTYISKGDALILPKGTPMTITIKYNNDNEDSENEE